MEGFSCECCSSVQQQNSPCLKLLMCSQNNTDQTTLIPKEFRLLYKSEVVYKKIFQVSVHKGKYWLLTNSKMYIFEVLGMSLNI